MNTAQLIADSQRFLTLSESDIHQDDLYTLQNLIRAHNTLYYNKDEPVISDYEYDQLFSLLKASEMRLDIYDPLSPTQRIDVLVDSQFQK